MSGLMLFYIIFFIGLGYILGKFGYVTLSIPIILIWAGIYGEFWAIATGVELAIGMFLAFSSESAKQKEDEKSQNWLEKYTKR